MSCPGDTGTPWTPVAAIVTILLWCFAAHSCNIISVTLELRAFYVDPGFRVDEDPSLCLLGGEREGRKETIKYLDG